MAWLVTLLAVLSAPMPASARAAYALSLATLRAFAAADGLAADASAPCMIWPEECTRVTAPPARPDEDVPFILSAFFAGGATGVSVSTTGAVVVEVVRTDDEAVLHSVDLPLPQEAAQMPMAIARPTVLIVFMVYCVLLFMLLPE